MPKLKAMLTLRQEVTFTIDGADAKDLDDAVHIKRLPNGNFDKKKQITKLQNDLKGTGMTLVPLKVYLKNGFARYCLVLSRKHDYDKRESIKRREQERDIKRIIKSVNR